MLKEHQEELANLKMDYEILSATVHTPFSKSLFSLIEGRMSDLEFMIAIDEYWEKR